MESKRYINMQLKDKTMSSQMKCTCVFLKR